MAMRPTPLTEDVITRRFKEGRGQGSHADYRPWLQAGDVPSNMGNLHRMKCAKTGRPVVLFSDVERSAYLFYEAQPQVEWIAEQYPLDRNKTRTIATALGIAHPKDPKTKVDQVMTTDLVVFERTERNALVTLPRSCKYAGNFSFNDAEHFEIERRYWEQEGCRLELLFNSDRCMPKALRQNLELLQGHRFPPPQQPFDGHFEGLCQDLLCAITAPTADRGQTLSTLIKGFADNSGRDLGQCMGAALYMRHQGHLNGSLLQRPYLEQKLGDVQPQSIVRTV